MPISRKKIIATPKRRRRRRFRYARLLILLGIFLAILLTIVVGFFYIPYFRITSAEVSGANQVNPNELKREIDVIASGNLMWIIPRDSFFLYPKEEIKKAILERHLLIKSAEFSFAGFNKIKLTVVERSPEAVYCTDACFHLDNEGYAYEEAFATSSLPILRDARFVPFVATDASSSATMITVATTTLDSPLGTSPLSRELFDGIVRFSELLLSTRLVPIETIVGSGDEITVRTDKGDLLVSKNNSLDAQLDMLKIALMQEAFRLGEEVHPFEYIDLRFGNKIFYKL